ncbi:5-formyltetrahydrofolate cyclo-ligase-like protein [Diplonema papillatum]|nr:5-formyltetrahydrofolate cyclo-ligase-like protein [Diplonema papillatum]
MPRRTKDEMRRMVWRTMTEEGVGRFPLPLEDRIPNFEGADDAARRLAALPAFASAAAVKANPDASQRPARLVALQAGKTVYMAVPQLSARKCFVRLNPRCIAPGALSEASTIKGAFKHGTPVDPEEMPVIDLVLAGSVVVSEDSGARLGKGKGYSDMEFGLCVELGLITDATVVVTTVHDLQVVPTEARGEKPGPWFEWPVLEHDIPVDYIVTPSRTVRVDPAARHARPQGIYWGCVTEDMRGRIPILRDLRTAEAPGKPPGPRRKRKVRVVFE